MVDVLGVKTMLGGTLFTLLDLGAAVSSSVKVSTVLADVSIEVVGCAVSNAYSGLCCPRLPMYRLVPLSSWPKAEIGILLLRTEMGSRSLPLGLTIILLEELFFWVGKSSVFRWKSEGRGRFDAEEEDSLRLWPMGGVIVFFAMGRPSRDSREEGVEPRVSSWDAI